MGRGVLPGSGGGGGGRGCVAGRPCRRALAVFIPAPRTDGRGANGRGQRGRPGCTVQAGNARGGPTTRRATPPSIPRRLAPGPPPGAAGAARVWGWGVRTGLVGGGGESSSKRTGWRACAGRLPPRPLGPPGCRRAATAAATVRGCAPLPAATPPPRHAHLWPVVGGTPPPPPPPPLPSSAAPPPRHHARGDFRQRAIGGWPALARPVSADRRRRRCRHQPSVFHSARNRPRRRDVPPGGRGCT